MSRKSKKKSRRNKNGLARRIGRIEHLENRMMLSATNVPADAPIVHAAFETAGFNFIYTGDTDGDGSMAVEYRTGGGAWQTGHEGVKVENYPRVSEVPTQRFEYASRLFGLTEDTTYEVRVTFDDPDGIVGQAVRTFNLTTRPDVVTTSGGTTYYVDPNAGPGGNGSAGNPYDEIADTDTVVSAGDTIELLDGIHEMTDFAAFKANGTANNPITITAAAGATPVVRGKFTGLEGPGTTWQDESATYPGVYSAPLADTAFQVYYAGEYLGETDNLANLVNGQRDHGSLRDIDLEGGWFQTGGRLYVKIPQTWGNWGGAAVDPSAVGIEPVVTDEGIFIQGSHWTIDGVAIEYFNTGLHVKNVASGRTGDNFTLRNSNFQFNKVGLKMNQSASILDDSGLNNALIENNTFTGTPNYIARNWVLGHDIYAVDAINANAFNGKNGVIRNNTISNMENGIYVGAWSQTPFSNPALTAGWVVRDNTLTNLGDDAVEVEGSGYQNVVIGNDIRQALTGISVAPASVGPVWAISNTIYQTDLLNPLGQPISNSLNSPFKFNSAPNAAGPLGTGTVLFTYHNSVYVSTTGSAAASARIQVPTAGVRWTSRNDSFVLANGTGNAFLQLTNLPTQYGVSPEDVFEFDFEYSNFWRSSGEALARMEGTDYNTLADWQAAGYNANGISSQSQFADPANGNFSVPASTDLQDAGILIPGINDNYSGNAPDIGVHEVSGSTATWYNLDVHSGTGDGNYPEATVVNVSASIPAGLVFDQWTGDVQYLGDASFANTTLTMPATAVTITATFATSSTTEFSLNVIAGSGDGNYVAGSVVDVMATIPAGLLFDQWTGDVQYLSNAADANTTLTMPSGPASITATFTDPNNTSTGTVYEVGQSGYAFSTIQAAVNTVFAQSSGSHIVRIMDSGVYDEYVIKANGGAAGVDIAIEAAAGQSPTLYGLKLSNTLASSVVIQGLTFDGSIRDYTDALSGRQAELVQLRDAGNITIKDSIFKGRGQYRTTLVYGEAGSTFTMENNLFDASTYSLAVDDTSGDTGTVNLRNNHFDGGDRAIDLTNARGAASGTITIENNIFDENGEFGVYYRGFGSDLPSTTVENNTFYRVGSSTPYLGGAIMLRDFTNGDSGIAIRDNLFAGQGASTSNYDGFNFYTTVVSDIDADNNGFYNMREESGTPVVAKLSTGWESVADLNAYTSAGGNVLDATDPFIDAAAGDFRLLTGSWAAAAATDGSFIGAFGIVQAAPDADFDQDNDVDGSDFLAWQRGFGKVAPNASDGDADNDQDVDVDDLTAWQNAYGQSASLAAVVSTDDAPAAVLAAVADNSIDSYIDSNAAAQPQPAIAASSADAALVLLQPTFTEDAADLLLLEEEIGFQDRNDSVSDLALPTQVPASEESPLSETESEEGNADDEWFAAIDQVWSTL